MKYSVNIKFESDDVVDFSAYEAAKLSARAQGYSGGSMSYPHPTALIKGDAIVAKWKNLTAKERAGVDGIIEGAIVGSEVGIE